jgi:hypothetical protein
VVPDSKAARTKIARNRNASANSASAKNKVVAGNRAAAISKVVINTEVTSNAGDKSGYIGLFCGGRHSRRFVYSLCQSPSVQIILQPPPSYRAILFL